MAYIGFGSNEGNRIDFCDRALTLLSLLPASQVTAVSSLYETEPVSDARSDPGPTWFLNGVVELQTEIGPRKLLEVCQEIEQALGRDQARRHASRTLDLDLLFYGTRVLQEPGLIVPHPRLHQRRFVLMPLAELAPDVRHPVLNRTVRELLEALEPGPAVRRLALPASRYGQRPTCSMRPPDTDPSA